MRAKSHIIFVQILLQRFMFFHIASKPVLLPVMDRFRTIWESVVVMKLTYFTCCCLSQSQTNRSAETWALFVMYWNNKDQDKIAPCVYFSLLSLEFNDLEKTDGKTVIMDRVIMFYKKHRYRISGEIFGYHKLWTESEVESGIVGQVGH